MPERHRALRSMIDEVMFEIRELTGQEYVNTLRRQGRRRPTPRRARRPGRPTSPTGRPDAAERARARAPIGAGVASSRRAAEPPGRATGPLRRLRGRWPPRSRSRSPTVLPASTRGHHRRRRRRVDRQAARQGRRRGHGRPTVARGRPRRAARTTATSVAIITDDTEAGRHVLRHSTAHVMAQAVTQLFPGAKFSIGPAIENGFYYDFELPGGATFSDDDLGAIEARMREIIAADQPFVRSEVSADEALDAVRRPALQGRDHRAGPASSPPAAATRRRSTPARSTPATRSASTATPTSSSTCARARTSRRRAGSATSSCRRSPARTGGATRRARCCSASTARRGSPRPR